MTVIITTKSLLPVRRDKQTGASFTSGGGGGGTSGGGGGSVTAAADILIALLTVDGADSGLDADLLDGLHATAFLGVNAKAVDSDKLDGAEGALYARLASPTFTGTVTIGGSGAGNGILMATGTEAFLGFVDRSEYAGDNNDRWGWYATGHKAHLYDVKSAINRITVQNDGNVSINGGVHIGGDSDAGNDNLWVDGLSKHPDFTSGWLGTNWQIVASGDAEFENLIVRGSAKFRELIVDQLAVVGGSDLLSIARGKIASVDVANSKVTLEDPNGRGTSAFAVNDFFWIKSIDIDNAVFNDCRGQISAITGVTLTLNFTVTGHNGAIADIAVGDVIVQRGHPTTASRQNLIYRTVSDTDNPFERYLTGVDSLAAFTDLDNVVLQSGNLNSLASHGMVPATPGVGLYSNNVYLSGKLVLPTAGMTDEGATASDIRIYAGDTYAHRAIAPFRVSANGNLVALGNCTLGSGTGVVDLGDPLSLGQISVYSKMTYYRKLSYFPQEYLTNTTLTSILYGLYSKSPNIGNVALTLPTIANLTGENGTVIILLNPGIGIFQINGNLVDIYLDSDTPVGYFQLTQGQSCTLYFEENGYPGWYKI